MKALLAVLALSVSTAAAAEPCDVLIRHVTVVDAVHGRLLADRAVAIRGADIVAVGADAKIAAQWQAGRDVDASGKYLLRNPCRSPGPGAGYRQNPR